MKSFFQKHTRIIIWLLGIIVVLSTYHLKKEWFDLELLKVFIGEHKLLVVLVYLLVLSILGLFFIPSTPFAIAGVVLFSPGEAYLYNLVGILTSSTIVYYFAKYLKLDQAFEEKYPGKIKLVQSKLERKELPIIIGWSLFPAVPTDLMIYAASSFKVRLWKCLIGVFIGEGILNLFYIFSFSSIFGFFV